MEEHEYNNTSNNQYLESQTNTTNKALQNNPAEIDVNIISITSSQIAEQNTLNMKYDNNYFYNISNAGSNESIKIKNSIRKASCDLSLFDCENQPHQNIEKESDRFVTYLRENENDNFQRRYDDNRIYLPEGETNDLSRENFERIKKCLITKKYKYIGETVNGKRDGFGICEYIDGISYIGMFKNDLKEGFGKIKYKNGDEESGEFSNDRICGYYECVKREEKNIINIKSIIKNKKYSEFIIYENIFINEIKHNSEVENLNMENVIIYEGEPNEDETSKISFGKLTFKKDGTKKIFIGKVLDYQIECGAGLFYKENSIYYGEINKNKQIVNYIENYSNETGCFLGFLKDSKKSGIGISFLKDGRVCFGEFEEDYKKGPIFIFSYSPKQIVKMELYILGFKTKTVEKMDSIKKYLLLNYPEFCYILKIDFEKLINNLTPQINEEISFSNKLIEEFKNELSNE